MKFINMIGLRPKLLKTRSLAGIANFFQALGSSERFGLGIAIFLHLALVIPLAAILNLWIDEAYTLETTGGGFIHAIQRALSFELQPPLYYVLLTLWRTLNDSVFFARLFSIICTASTVFLAGKLAGRYLPGVPPALAAAVVALNPLTVYTAVEARYYAMALLLSALLLWFLYDGYMMVRPSARARRWYTATAIAALYTYYFLGFLLVAGGAVVLVVRRNRMLRKYLLGMAITALLFVPLMVTTAHQVETSEATNLSPVRSVTQGATLVWQTAWRQLLPVNEDNSLAVVRSWISRLAIPVLLLGVFAYRRWPTPEVLVPLILMAVVSLFFIGVAMYLGPDFIKPQHTTVLYFPNLLTALALLQYVYGARAVTVGAVASFVFTCPFLLETYAPLAKQGDWIRVAQYIEQHEQKLEPILVFKAEFVLDFGYYYAGSNRLIPLPKPTSRKHYDLIEQVLHDENEIIRALSGQLGNTRRFWIVTSHTVPFRGIDPHPEILEQFIVRRCTVLLDKSFVASRVRLLELQPEAESGKKSIVNIMENGWNAPEDGL